MGGWVGEWVDGWWWWMGGGWELDGWVNRWVGINFIWCFNREMCNPGIKLKGGYVDGGWVGVLVF